MLGGYQFQNKKLQVNQINKIENLQKKGFTSPRLCFRLDPEIFLFQMQKYFISSLTVSFMEYYLRSYNWEKKLNSRLTGEKKPQNKSFKSKDHVTTILQFVPKCDLFLVYCKGNLLLRLFVMYKLAFRPPSFKSGPLSRNSFFFVKLNE